MRESAYKYVFAEVIYIMDYLNPDTEKARLWEGK